MSLFDLGVWIFYGFGKKPLYPMLWSVFFVVLFGFLWMDVNSKERGHAIKITALVWILLFMAFFGVFFQIDAILSRDLSIFFIVLLGIFWTVIWRNKSKGAIDEYTERWLNNISKAFSFSANVFLSGTKFFVDPPKIPELPRGPRSIVNGMFILERVLGAFFSILLFLAIAGTVVR